MCGWVCARACVLVHLKGERAAEEEEELRRVVGARRLGGEAQERAPAPTERLGNASTAKNVQS